MTCDEARDRLLERTANDAELGVHVAECADCGAVRKEMTMIEALLVPLTSAPVPARLQPRRRGGFGRAIPSIVAAATLLALLVLVFAGPAKLPTSVVAPQEEKPKAVNGLLLTITSDKDTYAHKDPVTLTATFENVGDKDLVLYVHHLSSIEGIVSFRLSSGGVDYRVPQFLGGTARQFRNGPVDCTLETIKPGEKRAYPLEIAAFQRGGSTTHLPLPEGEYTVTAEYARADNLVLHEVGKNLMESRTEKKAVDGLWVGTAVAKAVTFRVGAPTEVVGSIENPRDAAVLPIVVTNPLKRPVKASARATIMVYPPPYDDGIKASDGWSNATVSLLDGSALAEGATFPLELAAGETRTFLVDLAAISWMPSNKNIQGPLGLFSFAPRGGAVNVTIACEGDAGVKSVVSYADFVPWKPEADSLDGLELALEMKEGTARVLLKNTGKAPAVVNRRLLYAAEIAFSITDPDAGAGAWSWRSVRRTWGLRPREMEELAPTIAKGLAWTGDAFPKRAPMGREDFETLAPGASIEASFELSKLVQGGLPKGTYLVQAVYLNRESGRRFGLKGVKTGRLLSESVKSEVTGK